MKGRKGIREEKNDDYVISEARKLGHEQNIEFSVFAAAETFFIRSRRVSASLILGLKHSVISSDFLGEHNDLHAIALSRAKAHLGKHNWRG